MYIYFDTKSLSGDAINLYANLVVPRRDPELGTHIIYKIARVERLLVIFQSRNIAGYDMYFIYIDVLGIGQQILTIVPL